METNNNILDQSNNHTLNDTFLLDLLLFLSFPFDNIGLMFCSDFTC